MRNSSIFCRGCSGKEAPLSYRLTTPSRSTGLGPSSPDARAATTNSRPTADTGRVSSCSSEPVSTQRPLAITATSSASSVTEARSWLMNATPAAPEDFQSRSSASSSARLAASSRRSDLVQHEHFGLRQQRPGQRSPLQLTTGKLSSAQLHLARWYSESSQHLPRFALRAVPAHRPQQLRRPGHLAQQLPTRVKEERASWCTYCTLLRCWRLRCPIVGGMSSPPITMRPAVGRHSPATQRASVVLPARRVPPPPGTDRAGAAGQRRPAARHRCGSTTEPGHLQHRR